MLLVDSISTSETFMPQGPKVTTYDHAMKIFELGGVRSRSAAMISGVGDVGGTLVSQLMKRASHAIDALGDGQATHPACVDEVARVVSPAYRSLTDFIISQVLQQVRQDPNALENINTGRAARGLPPLDNVDDISEANIGLQGDTFPPGAEPDVFVQGPILEIVVATHQTDYSATVLRWPGELRTPIVVPGSEVGQVWWWGSGGSAVARVVKGYDNGLLATDISAEGIAVTTYFTTRSVDYQMPLLLAVMPLQEAVYFSEYLSDVACGYDRFKAGPASVGGAVNVMVITDEDRTWLRRDRIQSRPITV